MPTLFSHTLSSAEASLVCRSRHACSICTIPVLCSIWCLLPPTTGVLGRAGTGLGAEPSLETAGACRAGRAWHCLHRDFCTLRLHDTSHFSHTTRIASMTVEDVNSGGTPHEPECSLLNFIYACSICGATFADTYDGHNETVQGFSDGINPKDRLVTKLYLSGCCHVFCGDHIEGGGEFWAKPQRGVD